LRFQSQPPRHTEVPRPKRAEGQWSLGYTEPLNKNEQSKKDDDPLNVRARILHIYSKRGFDSIDPADLRGRFRWMGLYTQRKPGIDGGKTAVLEEEELDARYFMMRVRSDGRLLSSQTVGRSAPSASTSRATPPTSPTGRTSSTTGSASRTSRRSGSGSTTPA
jgi:sulfite reductase (ferredoxin)